MPRNKEVVKTWNYRVIHHPTDRTLPRLMHEAWWAIHEVHYEDGVPVAYGEIPTTFITTADDDRTPDVILSMALLRAMKNALELPIMELDEFELPRSQRHRLDERGRVVKSVARKIILRRVRRKRKT